MPVTNTQDISVFKTQMVLCFNSSGTFIDVIRDAPLLAGFKEAINTAPTPLKITLPRTFDSFDEGGATGSRGTIAQGNIWQYYVFGPGLGTSGLLRYQGQIDAYAPQIAENGQETVTVTLTPYGAILGDHNLVGTQQFGTPNSSGTYVDPVAMANWFFTNNDPGTGAPYMSPLTWAGSNPSSSGVTSQYTFQNEDMLSIYNTIMKMLPTSWYFRVNVDKTFTFNQTPTTATHQFILGRHIVAPQYQKDWMNLRNVATVKGSTASGVLQTRSGTDLATYGKRAKLYSDDRVTDTNTAGQLAQSVLNQYDKQQFRSKIRVVDYRGDSQTTIGYDIETIHPGDSCTIINPGGQSNPSLWDVSAWDQGYWDYAPGSTLNQVVQIVSLTYGFDYVDLELGTFQPNQDIDLLNIQIQFQNFSLI